MTSRRALHGAIALGACVAACARRDSWRRAGFASRVYASGFTAPVAFVQDPLDRSVQFVVEQAGRIRVVRSGTVQPTRLPRLAQRRPRRRRARPARPGVRARRVERALLRQLHRSIRRHGRRPLPAIGRSARRQLPRRGSISASAAPSGPAAIAQPFSNHNGGHLAFGPDGYLYIGLGDGGSGDDPDHRAQNPQELLGKMLRIDVNVPDAHAVGYQVPADNPFVGGRPVAARPEIWAFGLRNPWRYSFDDPARGGTGALVIGDVGQNAFEEIDYEPPNRGGRNYGWRNREGAHNNVTSRPPAFLPLVDPIHEYGRSSGQSITGGYVYRGRALGSAYVGRYFFADYVQGRVWSIGARDRRPGRGARRRADGAHRGARRPESARQHQLVRRRRRRRAVHRQPVARASC